jgi:hypothetical protein
MLLLLKMGQDPCLSLMLMQPVADWVVGHLAGCVAGIPETAR